MSKLTREGFRAMHEQAAEALERSRSSLNVLICAGTGCIASGSMKVYENLREECAQRGLQVYVGLTHHGDAEKSLHIKMSGCHGFCEMGPLVHIEPLGVMYVRVKPEDCREIVLRSSDHGGADVVLEVAGTDDTFRLAWECARPNAIVTVVALYDRPQVLPLPDMYGKNLTFKTGGVDGCDCAEILRLIEEGKIDTMPLITHRFPLNEIEEAYRIFENKLDGVMKVAVSEREKKGIRVIRV